MLTNKTFQDVQKFIDNGDYMFHSSLKDPKKEDLLIEFRELEEFEIIEISMKNEDEFDKIVDKVEQEY
jgi:hypothetical protein